MPWAGQIVFLDKASNQLLVKKALTLDFHRPVNDCQPTPVTGNRGSHLTGFLDFRYVDDATSNDFAEGALGFDVSRVNEEEGEPAKVNCCPAGEPNQTLR